MPTGNRSGQHALLAILVLAGLALCSLAGAVLGGGIGYYLGRHAGQATVRLSPLPPLTVPVPDLRKTLPPETLPWPSLTPRPRARVGARIVQVTAGSPAERAGLRPGDLIVAVDDRPLTPAQDLARAISSHEPGDTVELTIEREDGRMNVSVTLGASKEDPSRPYLGVRYVMQFSFESGVPDLFERWRGPSAASPVPFTFTY
jgi:membrane-associated protease RseP (regulator of RpoE activity)